MDFALEIGSSLRIFILTQQGTAMDDLCLKKILLASCYDFSLNGLIIFIHFIRIFMKVMDCVCTCKI